MALTQSSRQSQWGGSVTYLGYVEAKLKIPGIKQMDRNSLFMVINDSPYTETVPITIGTLHIRQAVKLATNEELNNLPEAWKVANFPPVVKQTTLNEPQLDLKEVQGKVTLTKNITLNPFETLKVSGNTSFRKHSKRVNVIIERPESHEHNMVAPVATYTVLKPGSTRIQFGLRNLLARSITLKSKTTIAKFSAANAVPDMLAPDPELVVQNSEKKDKLPLLSNEKQKELMIKLT